MTIGTDSPPVNPYYRLRKAPKEHGNMRFRKTYYYDRTDYTYIDRHGRKVTINVGDKSAIDGDEVTADMIKLLHSMDDAEVYNKLKNCRPPITKEEKAQCRKRAEYNLELAKCDFAKPESLSDDEIKEILGHVDELISWANDIKSFALGEALSGKAWANYKLVEGRSVRKYTNESKVVHAVKRVGAF